MANNVIYLEPMPWAGEVTAEQVDEAILMHPDTTPLTDAEWAEVERIMNRTRGPYELYPGDTGGFDDTDWELIGLSCIGAAVFTAFVIFAALFAVGMTAFN
jgi:hypothetical protein